MQEIIIKKEAETSDKFGCLPEKRPVEEIINYGVVNLDKPSGPTSHQVTYYVKEILGIKKAGHSGTLDPKVTGVLPIALGRASRVTEYLLLAGKEYVALMHLHKDIEPYKIYQAREKFIGKIKQIPPRKSAVKRRIRERTIYYIDILEIDGRDVLFKIGCEAGVYIRKLIHDFGNFLGIGAHMQDLRRTRVASFDESSLVTLQDLKDAYWYWKNEGKEKYIRHCILPVEKAVEHLKKVWIIDTAVDSITHGANLKVPGISKLHNNIEKDDLVAIMTLKNELVAVGKARMATKEIIDNDKGIAIITNKVFMLPGIYPRLEKKK